MSLAGDINEVFLNCLFKDEELPPKDEDMTLVEGITQSFGFHKERLASHKEKIRGFLNQMPPAFHKSGDGGATFLNLCITKDGGHWGEHKTMGELVCLGIGSGFVKYCLPREMWSALPGGVPYIMIDTEVA